MLGAACPHSQLKSWLSLHPEQNIVKKGSLFHCFVRVQHLKTFGRVIKIKIDRLHGEEKNYCRHNYRKLMCIGPGKLVTQSNHSLRSKRFQSVYCAIVRAEAKNNWRGRGGEKRKKRFLRSPHSLPSFNFSFLLLSQLSRRTSRENACYAGNNDTLILRHTTSDLYNYNVE